VKWRGGSSAPRRETPLQFLKQRHYRSATVIRLADYFEGLQAAGLAWIAACAGAQAGVTVTTAGTSLVGHVRATGDSVRVTRGPAEVVLARERVAWFNTDDSVRTKLEAARMALHLRAPRNAPYTMPTPIFSTVQIQATGSVAP
jgi:hypothetical protein